MDWLTREIGASFEGDRYPVHAWWLLLQVGCACTFWASLYAAMCIAMPRFRYEWHCRVVTAVHAIFVSILAFVDVFIIGRIPFYHTNQVLPYTELEKLIFTASLGYFLFDLAWCLYYQSEGAFMLFHHVMSILGLAGTLLMGKCGAEMAATVGGTEVTNPMLQLRWFMREQGLSGTRLMLGVELLFMASFGFMRLLAGGALAVSYFANPRTELLGRLAAAVIYGIGVVFYAQLCLYCLHRFRRRPGITHAVAAAVSATAVTVNGHSPAQASSSSSAMAAATVAASAAAAAAGVSLSYSASAAELLRLPASDTAVSQSSRKHH